MNITDNDSRGLLLIVDDVLENLAYLHDALDESGYTVLVADSGEKALERARQAQPDLILLDAMMPGMDGFETCRKLKMQMETQHIPVIFMTGLSEAEHVAAGFDAGGVDYVTKPVRPKEVLARIASHLQTFKHMDQARSAMDAFGQGTMAINATNMRIVWLSPLARKWMKVYLNYDEASPQLHLPEPVFNWISQLTDKPSLDAILPLNVIREASRLVFTLGSKTTDGEWLVMLTEESDVAKIEAIMTTFHLTKRESEVLYWTVKGKTNRDVGDILQTSPRTVNKHLEHVFAKLGVETRTAAAAMVTAKLRFIK